MCATAESCTGGGIAGLLTAIAGSSEYVLGGIIAYANPVKVRLLGVSAETLRRVGAVSAECAIEMARGARAAFGADVALSSTGIAGPGGATARKPVGLVYLGVATPEREVVREMHLSGGRLDVIHGAIEAAIELALATVGAQAPEME
jgi:PncC family amidohydrolase